MKFDAYKELISNYIRFGSKEKLLSEVGYPPEVKLELDNYIKAVKIVAAAADSDINALIKLSGLKGTEFSKKFVKPYSTLQKWVAKGSCPESDALYIGFIMIIDLEEEQKDEKEGS